MCFLKKPLSFRFLSMRALEHGLFEAPGSSWQEVLERQELEALERQD